MSNLSFDEAEWKLAALYSALDFAFPEGDRMEFHLTYAGQLIGGGGADHIMDIRKAFHPQLRKLWDDHPLLKAWPYPPKIANMIQDASDNRRMKDYLAGEFNNHGYRFVPLALAKYSAIVSLDILFLRSGIPGAILRSADLDKRLKVLVDGLRMPGQKQELGTYTNPDADEDPFFCLMQDDKLVSNMTIRTDSLLEPTTQDRKLKRNDARIFIKVKVGTYEPATFHMPFT